jgi:hypothetical protein
VVTACCISPAMAAAVDFMAGHDQEMADLKREMEILLGPEDKVCSKTFVETVSGSKATASSRQSKLALENGKAIASGAIPDGPEPPKSLQLQKRPNSKFSDGPLLPPPGHSVTTTTTVTTTVQTRTEVGKAAAPLEVTTAQPPPTPIIERKTEPIALSSNLPPLTMEPAAVAAVELPPFPKVIQKKQEEVQESVRPPPADLPKATKTETMKSIAGFINLANPPSKPSAEAEKQTVKSLQTDFYRDRIADSVAMKGAISEDTSMPDKKPSAAAEEIKSNEIAKAPAVATPSELVHKAAIEKAKLEEVKEHAKRKAQERKAEEEAKKLAKSEKQKAKKAKPEPKTEDVVMKHEDAVPLPSDEKVTVVMDTSADSKLVVEKEEKKKKKKHKKDKKRKDKDGEKKKKHKKDKEKKEKKKKHHDKEEEPKKKKKVKTEDKSSSKAKQKAAAVAAVEAEKKGSDFILDDEAVEVDAPLSDEEESLDEEEAAAENASDDSIIPDTDGEDSISDAGDDDVDEDGNLADFVA